jgi:FtsZ-binding cell division protein ZapB
MMERARQEYPRETAELLATLASWRERIRARLGDWEPSPE